MATGVLQIVTEAAKRRLARIQQSFSSFNGDRERFLFDVAKASDVHFELERLGMITRMLGVPGGFAWALTELGVLWSESV